MEAVSFIPIRTFNQDFTEFIQLYNPIIDIKLITLTGKKIALTISKYDTVQRLKKRIYALENILIDQQKLSFNGKCLDDTNTLDHYGITTNSTVHLILRLRGGMFHATSSRHDWVSLNHTNKLQTGLQMIHHMRSYGIALDTLDELQRELEKCNTDQEIDVLFALIEKYYVE